MGMTSLTRSVVPESKLVPVEADALAPLAGARQLDRHPVAVYLASLSPGSRPTMLTALRTIASLISPEADAMTFPWASLDFAHTAAIRTKLGETYAPATANKILAALRGAMKMSFRLGLISADQLTRATSFDAVRGTRVPKGRAISQGELRALFGLCDALKPVGARDAALLALLYAAGLRRAEVVGLDYEDFDQTTGAITVTGKGNKQRKVFIANGARAALDAWLCHRGDEPGALLLPVKKGGTVERRRMTDQAVAERLRLLGRRAKLQHFSAHDFRRTFVGDLLDGGADIATVQALAGHASPTTTAKYDRRGERTKVVAASMLHVPFGG